MASVRFSTIDSWGSWAFVADVEDPEVVEVADPEPELPLTATAMRIAATATTAAVTITTKKRTVRRRRASASSGAGAPVVGGPLASEELIGPNVDLPRGRS